MSVLHLLLMLVHLLHCYLLQWQLWHLVAKKKERKKEKERKKMKECYLSMYCAVHAQ